MIFVLSGSDLTNSMEDTPHVFFMPGKLREVPEKPPEHKQLPRSTAGQQASHGEHTASQHASPPRPPRTNEAQCSLHRAGFTRLERLWTQPARYARLAKLKPLQIATAERRLVAALMQTSPASDGRMGGGGKQHSRHDVGQHTRGRRTDGPRCRGRAHTLEMICSPQER